MLDYGGSWADNFFIVLIATVSVNLLNGGSNSMGSGGLKEADPISSGCPRGSRCLGVQMEEVILGQ